MLFGRKQEWGAEAKYEYTSPTIASMFRRLKRNNDPPPPGTALQSPIIENAESGISPRNILNEAANFTIENSILTHGDLVVHNFLHHSPPTEEFRNIITQNIVGQANVEDLDKRTRREYTLGPAIRDLPRIKAAYDDYTPTERRRTACFKGTRDALLKEIAEHVTSTEWPHTFLLFGIAGTGKSTIAQTVAERTDSLRLLGASFFFSREKESHRTAENFFTSIAFQLCTYNEQFAQAIGAVMVKEQGASATSKDPREQLTKLIIEPLWGISRSSSLPTLIVVDALDECETDDASIILAALSRLVQELPSFKVVLTARPQPHLQSALHKLGHYRVFRMEDIDWKVVHDDIRHYLEYNLSAAQVDARLRMLHHTWAANDEEIEFLTRAAGQLFFIASAAVLFILNVTAYNPQSQMKTIREELARGRTPFNTLKELYNVVLCNAVPLHCEPDIVERYRVVVGTIVLIQSPLPVGSLANLIGTPEGDMYAVLNHLLSVIYIDSNDVPFVYHNSFPDYVTDVESCQDVNHCIVPKAHHTFLATRCIHIMNKNLKRNILGLNDSVQQLNNEAALKEAQLSDDDIRRTISSELRYALIHWANHVAQAHPEDGHLMIELKKFADEHLLHWLEALSWIQRIGTARTSLGIILRLQNLDSDTRQMFSSVLRFTSKNYEKIKQSAQYMRVSMTPFMPAGSLSVGGGPVEREITITKQHEDDSIVSVAFAKSSSRFASWASDCVTLWEGSNGTPIRTFDREPVALSDDFSILAVPQDSSVTTYRASSNAPIASFDHPSKVVQIAISSDGFWMAAGLQSGSVCVWDAVKEVSVANLDDCGCRQLAFSPTGCTLALMLKGGITLWRGPDDVAELDHELEEPVKFAFSRDGARFATLAKKGDVYGLRLWNGGNGDLIAVGRDVGAGGKLAISADGSLIATAVRAAEVWLWSGDSLAPLDILPIKKASLAFAGDMLAIASFASNSVTLYDVKNYAGIAELQMLRPTTLALSPDGSRLAVGNVYGSLRLWDISSFNLPKRLQ